MIYLIFYSAALVVFGVGAYCIRTTLPHGTEDDEALEAEHKRKIIGIIVMVVAVMAVVAGGITQFIHRHAAGSATGMSVAPASIAPVATSLSEGFQLTTNSVSLSSPLAAEGDIPAPVHADSDALTKAEALFEKNQYDAAVEQASLAIKAAPQDPTAYVLRGGIYVVQKRWELAEKDYQAASQIDTNSVKLKFNLAVIQFALKRYDAARVHFDALQKDPLLGDLAQYHVFLCDLLSGHEDVAAREFAVFNQAGTNASYYFANAAWSLYHQKKDDAHQWLASASHIYSPYKYKLYADSLAEFSQP